MFGKVITDSKTVHDKVTFRAGDEKITLRVDKDGRQIVIDLQKVREQMSKITDENMEAEIAGCAQAYAAAMFGDEQAAKLMDFYNNPLSVVNVCGQYFKRYLDKKITKAQVL